MAYFDREQFVGSLQSWNHGMEGLCQGVNSLPLALDVLLQEVKLRALRRLFPITDPMSIQFELILAYCRLLTLERVWRELIDPKFRMGQIPWVVQKFLMKKTYTRHITKQTDLESKLWITTIHLLEATHRAGVLAKPYLVFVLLVQDSARTNLLSLSTVEDFTVLTKTRNIRRWQEQNAYLAALDDTAPTPWPDEQPYFHAVIGGAMHLANRSDPFRKRYYRPWIAARTAMIKLLDSQTDLICYCIDNKITTKALRD